MRQINLIVMIMLSLILISCNLSNKTVKDRLEELNEKEKILDMQIYIKYSAAFNLRNEIKSDLEKSKSATTLSKTFFTTIMIKLDKYAKTTVESYDFEYGGYKNLVEEYLDVIKSNSDKFKRYNKLAENGLEFSRKGELEILEQLKANSLALLESKKSVLENPTDYDSIKSDLNSNFTKNSEFYNKEFKEKIDPHCQRMLDLLTN